MPTRDSLVLVLIGAVVVLLGMGIGLAWALHKSNAESAPDPAASGTEIPSASGKSHFPVAPKPSASDQPAAPPVTPVTPDPPPPAAPKPAPAPAPRGPSNSAPGKKHHRD
jgi:hypothetical protein